MNTQVCKFCLKYTEKGACGHKKLAIHSNGHMVCSNFAPVFSLDIDSHTFSKLVLHKGSYDLLASFLSKMLYIYSQDAVFLFNYYPANQTIQILDARNEFDYGTFEIKEFYQKDNIIEILIKDKDYKTFIIHNKLILQNKAVIFFDIVNQEGDSLIDKTKVRFVSSFTTPRKFLSKKIRLEIKEVDVLKLERERRENV